jgi:hypothetical protein
VVRSPHGEEVEFRPYERGDGNIVLRPILMISLGHEGQYRDFPMLIDTGADDVVLPEFVALEFGINLMDGDLIQRGMLLGTAFGYAFQGFRVGFAAYFEDLSFAAPVLFTSRLNSTGYGLLGRDPLLDHFWFRFGNDAGHVFRFGPLTG